MTPTRLTVALIAATSLIAACGGGGDDAAEPTGTDDTQPTSEAAVTTDGSDTVGTTATDASEDAGAGGTDDGSAGDADEYEPGAIEYRVVNTLDQPVDIYTRTTGLIEAYLIEESVAPGTVTEFVAPPADGTFVVTEAGAGDATCVTTCDHFIAELGSYVDEGPVRTVVLYDDEFNGPSALDLWEQTTEVGQNSNAMVAADPDSGIVVVTGIALTDADFGLRLGFDGVVGCVAPFNLENLLVGGNQTPAFTYDGESADALLYANDDEECAETAVGGPFTVEGGGGTRSHLILTGSPGDMDGIVVLMADDGSGSSGASDGDEESAGAPDGDRDLAIELMAEEMVNEIGLSTDEAECAAPFLVDSMGVEDLLDGNQLVDLDSLPVEYEALAGGALAEAVPACDIDPAVFE